MKPSWSDAPEWAKYLAMDEDGEWRWYDSEPGCISYMGRWDCLGTKWGTAGYNDTDWRDTLEPRPLDTST